MDSHVAIMNELDVQQDNQDRDPMLVVDIFLRKKLKVSMFDLSTDTIAVSMEYLNREEPMMYAQPGGGGQQQVHHKPPPPPNSSRNDDDRKNQYEGVKASGPYQRSKDKREKLVSKRGRVHAPV